MKPALIVLTSIWLLAACSGGSDTAICRRLIGAWGWATPDGRTQSITTYQSNGKFIRQFIIQSKSGTTKTVDQTGTFQVKDRMLEEAVLSQHIQHQEGTNTSLPYRLPQPRIIHIDARELVLRYKAKELPEGAATNEMHLRRAAE